MYVKIGKLYVCVTGFGDTHLQNAEIWKFHCSIVFHMIMCMSCFWPLIIIHIFIYVTHQKLFYTCKFINYLRLWNYTYLKFMYNQLQQKLACFPRIRPLCLSSFSFFVVKKRVVYLQMIVNQEINNYYWKNLKVFCWHEIFMFCLIGGTTPFSETYSFSSSFPWFLLSFSRFSLSVRYFQ